MTDDIRTKKLMNAPEDIIPEAIEGRHVPLGLWDVEGWLGDLGWAGE